jgi:hypothetical protein
MLTTSNGLDAVNGATAHDVPASAAPPPSASFRAFLRYVTAALSPESALRALTLASELSDAQVEALFALLRAMDDRAVAVRTDEEDATWQAILAHLPGIAPSLEVIRAHVQGVEPGCSAAGACTRCTRQAEQPARSAGMPC